MSDTMKLVQNQDGAFSAYDDTYDITIHCETEEEQKKVIERLESTNWIPASADVMIWTAMNMRRSAKNMKIDELGLAITTRTYNILLRAGITTTEEIKEKSDDDLKRIRNMSEKCYKEIKQAVYCTDCKRSIYGEYHDCDVNMESGGRYLRGDCKCHCKVFMEE